MSGGRPSVAEALQAHTSVICLQHPARPTAGLNKCALKKKKKKVFSTVPFVSGWKPDTQETSKQKKLKSEETALEATGNRLKPCH